MNRTQLLNELIKAKGYRSYLEIGCSRDTNFRAMKAEVKVGVDPERGGTVRMTSDEFFAQNAQTFDLVFVDGLHLREQVVRDAENAVQCLSPGGCTVLHDCLPTKFEHQVTTQPGPGKAWTGDVWKAVVDLRQQDDLDIAVLDDDWGLGVLFVRPNSQPLEMEPKYDWESFVEHRDQLLRVMDVERIWRFVGEAAPQCDDRMMAGIMMQEALDSASHHSVKPSACGSLLNEADGATKRTIVLAHSNLAQFRHLHTYLNQSGLATSYLMCSEANFRKHGESIPNLVPFQPHGNKLHGPESFYYTSRIEDANRRSLGIRKVIERMQKEMPIHLYVGHVTGGSPSMLFDDFDFSIITYLEWPCFRSHGWDENFPPPDIKQLRDKNFEQLTWHAVQKSDHAIVPSAYARSLFPRELQAKISVMPEGFPLTEATTLASGILAEDNGLQYVGFAARDLSTAKGFDQFIRIANRVAEQRPNVRFVVLGSDNLSYSYENHFLDDRFGEGHGKSFRQWVMEQESADPDKFIFPGLVPYDEYSQYLNDVDLFLYPLRFGSANWGLFELLNRGKPVIASDRCFVPEIIAHGANGLLCDYDDLDAWVRRTLELLDNTELRCSLGETARTMAKRYSIEVVAREFLSLCEQVLSRENGRGTS